MKKQIMFVLVLILILIMGCNSNSNQLQNNDAYYNNDHNTDTPTPVLKIETFDDCASAGYPIMESYPRKCSVPNGKTFTESIPKQQLPEQEYVLVGDDEDEHGCKGSAGYRWCEATKKCQRFLETACPSELKQNAKIHCGEQNVGTVYLCGDVIKVLSVDSSISFFDKSGNPVKCDECDSDCEKICEPSTVLTDEDRAGEIARSHVAGLSIYTSYNGRNLVSNNVQVLRCPGCFDVEVVFDRDSVKDSSMTTHATVHIKLINWKVSDVTSTFAEQQGDFTMCEDNCGNGICEEIVCEATGCPCPENKNSCPEDCS